MSDADPPEPPRERAGSQTLLRGLDIIEQLSGEPLRIAEVSDRLELTFPTTQRLAYALIDRGFLKKLPRGQLALGPKLVQLGFLAREQIDMLGLARAGADALCDTIGLCVFIGARDGDVALHLHRAMGRQRIEVATRPGTRRALADTGLGKALMFDDTPAAWARLFMLARPEQDDGATAIDEMRAHVAAGVVLHHSTSDDTIRSVAAPVRDASGAIVAALSVASPVQYLDEEKMGEIAPQVLRTVREISAALGWRGADAQKPEGK
ncbi:IclR family transcriptional regulator [Sphingomonas psychrotolerans]|uniref:Transcriptional regulator n=1 Tax=Sphingomonas psychrotolerans TaxID=1327635 RepID=A0A2K8MF50_9SPHN|nr:IclR family transcriptional regulator [Sphingomonas psychrotolerans]ATY31594.1 transcriptional regulator [Sphingomonas psychrotolerans]